MTDEPLPLPAFVDWPIFPFVGELHPRELLPVLDAERPRTGEPGNEPCHCEADAPDGPLRRGTVWRNERWVVKEIRRDGLAAPFPTYMLEPVEHLDFGDMDDSLAAEFGVLSLRLERAIMRLGTVGRVHINRWGDGGSHCHVWFMGRPKGAWQFSGFSLGMWFHMLPPMSDDEVEANHAALAAALRAADSN